MSKWKGTRAALGLLMVGAFACTDTSNVLAPPADMPSAREPVEATGNNLSFPVLWAEGVTKTLRGTPGMVPILGGAYWYQWGTNGVDPDVVPASCPADVDEGNAELNPDGLAYCDDGIPSSLTLLAGVDPADSPLPLARAYLQKDALNTWQAGSADVSSEDLFVDWIDWGDNLESQDWYTRSQVRTEVVLLKDLVTPMTEYEMRHTSGWGIDEVHGLAAEPNAVHSPFAGAGTQATVYSHCARLTIQKLLVDRADTRLASLVWVPTVGWTEAEGTLDALINDPIFNKAVWAGGDGPGYYSAEINVKGKIIYGYTWSVAKLNDTTPLEGTTMPTPAGVYRITFSLDETCGTAALNTYLSAATILVPVETEAVIQEEPVGGGAVAVLRGDLNLTYMDVRILPRSGGGGGGKGGKS